MSEKAPPLKIKYPEVAVCGLSCRLCPSYHRDTPSRCPGCKTEFRMGAACPMVNCAIKRMKVEFCWECPQNETCTRFNKHKEFSRTRDTSTCYQRLEDNLKSISKHGIEKFIQDQKEREYLLREMLAGFNEGRSKTRFCIAATIFTIDELKRALTQAKAGSSGNDIKDRSKIMNAKLDEIARKQGYCLKLRK